MRSRYLRYTHIIGAGLVLAGCNLIEPAGVSNVTQLEVSLALNAQAVSAGDTVLARAQVANVGVYDAAITSVSGCLGRLSVRRGGVERSFRSEPGPCWAAPSPVVVPAGDTLVHEWRIETVSPAGTPFAPGIYHVVVDLDGELERGSTLPDVARELTVQ